MRYSRMHSANRSQYFATMIAMHAIRIILPTVRKTMITLSGGFERAGVVLNTAFLSP